MYHIRAQSKRAINTNTTTTSTTTAAATAGSLTAAAVAAALDDAEAAAAEKSVQSLLDSTPQAAFPLPKGQYPAFDGYPKFVTNYQVRAVLCAVLQCEQHAHACALVCMSVSKRVLWHALRACMHTLHIRVLRYV
jgi:hypothetical protein